MKVLYPEIDPYRTGFLRVSDLHELYFEESGKPSGKPALFIHGGPGSHIVPQYRQYFDPTHYRIVLFDQRGCGKSKPNGCLEENTTNHLIDDIEKLRIHLDIEEWLLFGGSWGSALSIAYAEEYPRRVNGLILRGMFALRKREIAWFYQRGASAIFPDEFDKFRDFIPEAERDDLVSAYYRYLTCDNVEMQIRAAKAWCRWEASTSFIIPRREHIAKYEDASNCLAFAKIECHYFANGGFFESETLLFDHLPRIRHIPARIIQGRYDLVCPMETAWDFHKAWPEAEFVIVPSAGHSSLETDIIPELVSATDDFRSNVISGNN